ncbi:MAG: hypothetical protein AABO57_22785 [Acidobacteriota bacterium]
MCAQTRSSVIPSEQNTRSVAPRNARIISLVEQLADQARASDDLTFAVRAQSQAAKLLWPLDPERARAIYRRAFQSLASGASKEAPEQAANANPYSTFEPSRALIPTPNPQLRSELLNQIAACDPELAEEFARDLAASMESSKTGCADCNSNGGGSSWPFGQVAASAREDAERCELLMSAALQVVERQPQQAMAFAQMSVALGISSNLARLLTLMRTVDAERADLLFANAVARLEQSSRVDLKDIHTLGSYVVSTINSSTRHPMGKASIVRFLNLALKQVGQIGQNLSAPPASGGRGDSAVLYFIERQLTDLLASYLPDRLDQLQRYTSATRDAGTYEAIDPEKLRISSPGDIAREASEAAEGAERDSLYARAALAWLAQGEPGEAQAAALKVSAAPMRDRVLIQIVRRLASGKRIEESIGLTRRITGQTSRVDLLVMLSAASRASNDNVRAVELLNEAESYSTKQPPSIERARSLVKIAGSFSSFDALRSFEVLQTAVKAIDEIIKQQQALKDDPSAHGTRATVAQVFTLDEMYGTSFERTLIELGKADFDRALFLAQQLTGEEAPVIAQLAVCRGGLVENPPSGQSAAGEEGDSGVNH